MSIEILVSNKYSAAYKVLNFCIVCLLKELQQVMRQCVDTRRQTSEVQSTLNHKTLQTLIEKLETIQVCLDFLLLTAQSWVSFFIIN